MRVLHKETLQGAKFLSSYTLTCIDKEGHGITHVQRLNPAIPLYKSDKLILGLKRGYKKEVRKK